jgi:protein tyrosine/serine phosphatase
MNLQENIRRIREMMGINIFSENYIISESFIDKEFSLSKNFSSEVESLQKELKAMNYDLGTYGPNKDGVDGRYGKLTKLAHEAAKTGKTPEKFNDEKDKLLPKKEDVSDSSLKSYNFHSIPDGKGNYRSAQLPPKLLEYVIDKYNIKNIIRLNGDGKDSKHHSSDVEVPVETERQIAKSKGVNFMRLSSTGKQEQVNQVLGGGGTLIHCAHGADRTGGNVGGYLYSTGWGDTKKIWDYTTQLNGWNKMIKSNPNTWVNGGYLEQAKKFGVRDLSHANQLSN